tara:strand:- start:221 stop:1066 length:846 start_codon:yes stop_codon:yes gene_type:complete
MENVKNHNDIKDLSFFSNDKVFSRQDQEINGVKYYGQDVIVNDVRVGNFSGQYQINKTADILTGVNDFLDSQNMLNTDVTVEDKSWGYGGRNARVVTFCDPQYSIKMNEQAGDKINLQLIILNSYDGGLKASINFGLLRMLCANGMINIDSIVGTNKKHTKKDVLGYEYGKLKNITPYLEQQRTQLQRYENTVVSLDVVRETLKNTIAKNEVKQEQIMEYVKHNNRGTADKVNLMSVYNGVTEWATHHGARKTSDMNNVYLSRQMDVTKMLQSENFMQLVA